ncbi:MAG TPA: cellulase [Prolixibacteraceae bacterium]|nr:cellulase [Prolixibacteraceae bacterium]
MNLRNLTISTFLLLFTTLFSSAVEVIRVNQLGYLPQSVKVAVFISSEKAEVKEFTVHQALTGKVVFTGEPSSKNAKDWGMQSAFRLDFSKLENPGGYYIQAGETRSPNFRIDNDVYEGTADFILNYLRQQRCGFNPYLSDSCHTHDGIVVDHPTKTGQFIDVTGGWHDATDYLQYSTTSINTVYQMMFAYQKFPEIYSDAFDASGMPGSNGVADILDEIKWGLEWMLKMNPAPGEMYNQIADDRDHIGFRLPVGDKANYGLGEYRPVYFATGKPQGLSKYKNQSTGVSSIAGKFASGFALGAEIFEKPDAEFAAKMKQKALEAWEFALSDTGYCQTASNVSPYFYEESNFADDLELAAAQLFQLTDDPDFLKEANYWGNQEPVSPWIKNGTARHYQSYPFVNLGHYLQIKISEKPASYYGEGLDLLFERGNDDPFFHGLPFIWCSNNLLAGAITQARLYREHTGDLRFAEMEASLRDWLFGCNPWGTAMICGLPGVADSPEKPHSSYTVLRGETTPGGLVDGPIAAETNKNLIGITLLEPDEYASFNYGKAVYHDDIGDYSTNEPTMDGTASLSFYLAALENEGRKSAAPAMTKENEGATVRINQQKKVIYIVFSADKRFEGGEHILTTLKKNRIKGSFFFTGNFLRNPDFAGITEKIVKQGHFVGAHSDRHLLYCDWQKRDSTLISKEEFQADLKANFSALQKFRVKPEKARFFLSPYEWYNNEIANWSRELGLILVNFTFGTGTNADYTTPEMPNYKSSEQLMNWLMDFEAKEPQGLNGSILLIHPGTEDARTDKFYLKLNELIETLEAKGYQFKSFNDI